MILEADNLLHDKSISFKKGALSSESLSNPFSVIYAFPKYKYFKKGKCALSKYSIPLSPIIV
jgi:hypothetical protein